MKPSAPIIMVKEDLPPPEPENWFTVPSGGFFCQGLHDWETEYYEKKPRVIKDNYKKGSLPETIPLTSHPEFTPLPREWQEFILKCLIRAGQGTMTDEEILKAYISLTANSRSHFDGHAVENGYECFVTGRNKGSSLGPIAIKCLGFGGHRFELDQGGFYGTRYRVKTLKVSDPPPSIEEFWKSSYLMWCTESTPDQLPDRTWISGRFPQMKPFGTPLPLISPEGWCYVSRDRVKRMEAGTRYSPYHPATA